MADFERYTPPDPLAPGRYASVEKVLAQYGDQYAVIVHLNDVFSLPRYLMGMENLLMAIAAEPELVQALVDMSVEINLVMAKELVARGVQIVYTGDDYASSKGPLMSPRHFRKLFYPGLCRVMGGFKELGLLVIKHTDGNLWPIMDMIVDSGIDCLDPDRPEGRHEHPRGQGEVRRPDRAQGQRGLRRPADLRLRRGDGRGDQAGVARRDAGRRVHHFVEQQHPLGREAGELRGDDADACGSSGGYSREP